MSRDRWSALLCAVIISAMAFPSFADTLDSEQFINNTGQVQRQFNVVFSGGPLTNQTDPLGNTSTFEYSGTATFPNSTFTYDPSTGLTTYSFTGASVAAAAAATVGTAFAGVGSASPGIDGLSMVAAYWGTDPSANAVPAITTAISAVGGTGPLEYVLVYAAVQDALGNVTTQLSEYAVTGGATVTVDVEDRSFSLPVFTGGNLTQLPHESDIAYQFSPTQIPLDDLNPSTFTYTPATGISNGTEIDPGNSVQSDPFSIPLPEPSSAVLLGLGAAAMLVAAHRRWPSKA